MLTRSELGNLEARAVRQIIREGGWTGTSKRLALGREQANIVILREEYALDFFRFCHRNPKPLFLIEVTDTGDPEPKICAPGADLRTDLPAYRLYRDGEAVEDLTDIKHLWRDDHVAFLTGCNLSVDQVMIENRIPLPHLIDDEAWPSQYISNISCQPAGIFKGPQVVSMRPIPEKLLIKVIEITSRYPRSHGAPLHVGDPFAIGIDDLNEVDWGKLNKIGEGFLPVFWACGITAQAVACEIKIPEMITHKPGHMFVTDIAVADPTK
ncbi:MAG: hypothetical protein CMF69_08485 [Magnetovibrio sp.]|nr:hypothetical protein [Magnetovibrio sp.]|tara:strand:+ start:1675 stop:2475 length:801 start_codon:yes stop_codon:yes gene_type:complete